MPPDAPQPVQGGHLAGPFFPVPAWGDRVRAGGAFAQSEEVHARLVHEFRDYHGLAVGKLPIFADAHYYLPTPDEIDQLAAGTLAQKYSWCYERFDCDDYAYVFKGECSKHAYKRDDIDGFALCVGLICAVIEHHGEEHWQNWFMANTGEICLIDLSKGGTTATVKKMPDKVVSVRCILV